MMEKLIWKLEFDGYCGKQMRWFGGDFDARIQKILHKKPRLEVFYMIGLPIQKCLDKQFDTIEEARLYFETHKDSILDIAYSSIQKQRSSNEN